MSAIRFSVVLFTLLVAGNVAELQAADTPLGHWQASATFADQDFMMTLDSAVVGFMGGQFQHNSGYVQGRISGWAFEGVWRQQSGERRCAVPDGPAYHWGKVRFEFSADYRSFSGSWGFCDDDPSNSWSGRKVAHLFNLPANGAIEPRGMLPAEKALERNPDCDCQAVTLARITSGVFDGRTGSFVTGYRNRQVVNTEYDVSTRLRQSIVLRPLGEKDMLCLTFAYPPEEAYFVPAGKPHSCKVTVTMSYPYAASSTDRITEQWELFAIQGMAEFRSGGGNQICRVMSNKGDGIPPGDGVIETTVNGIGCDTVRFTVDPARVRSSNMTVKAALEWQKSGVFALAGEDVRVSAAGEVQFTGRDDAAQGGKTGPAGVPLALEDFSANSVEPAWPHAAVIAKVGRQTFLIGSGGTFAPYQSGEVDLRINDTDIGNNDGEFMAQVLRVDAP